MSKPESKPKVMRVTKAGALRSGSDGHGSVVHLIEIPDGANPQYVPGWGLPALCGATPGIMWSDWTPKGKEPCKRCVKVVSQQGAEVLS